MPASTDSVGTTKTPVSASRRASSSATSASIQAWTSPSAPSATASIARSKLPACTTASSPSAWAAAISAPIVSPSSAGISRPNALPSSDTILIQSEPSSARARTHPAASSGPATASTGVPNCVPCPPAAVASMPAEKRSASDVRPIAARPSRWAAMNAGSVNWSSTEVTPKRSASPSAPGNACTCASTSPGSSVWPRPSTRGRSSGSSSPAPTSRTRPFSTHTSWSGENATPSNRSTSTIAKLPSADGWSAAGTAQAWCSAARGPQAPAIAIGKIHRRA